MAGGRPKKVIDYGLVKKLASVMCTVPEMAAMLGVSVRTCERDAEFCRVRKEAMETAKASLRRVQYKSAMNGNTSMQIWLGKQYLDQKEKVETENTHDLKMEAAFAETSLEELGNALLKCGKK